VETTNVFRIWDLNVAWDDATVPKFRVFYSN
jgi:hypothetical protein